MSAFSGLFVRGILLVFTLSPVASPAVRDKIDVPIFRKALRKVAGQFKVEISFPYRSGDRCSYGQQFKKFYRPESDL